MNPGLLVAFLLPLLALGVQWVLWPWIAPFVWFLFFPAVFFSARIGGLRGGLAGTVLSAGIVWYFFIPPRLGWAMENPANLSSVGMFLVMGYLFSDSQERLRRAQRETGLALAESRAANARIEELYRRTLELDELKSQFFANVSHELRTPLTLIMSPLARRLAAGDLTPEQRHEAELMLRNARLLYRQVSDLLDAAKLEAGRMVVAYSRVDFGALTRAMASQFDSIARERSIDYRIDVPIALEMEADGEKLQRILLNLLSNAFKFTPAEGRISVGLRREGESVVLEVGDSGPGVPVEYRMSIFERFRQIEGGAERRHGGTGLGLAIVREFTELHGGSASVTESSEGGALFRVRLPQRAPAGAQVHEKAGCLDGVVEQGMLDELHSTAAAGAAAGAEAAGANAPLVLVAEDNADMSAYIAEALRPRYRVACAFNGREGLQRSLALQPDLILADVMMPEMTGDRMVIELRRHAELADTPIVMLTAKADEALRVRLLQAGVQDYLGKPFSVDELLARVEGLLAERRRTLDRKRASDLRFDATFEQAAVGMAIDAPDGCWLRVNRRLCEILGVCEAELLGRSVQDSTAPDDREADREYRRRMLAGEIDRFSREKRCLRRDGTLGWINIAVALVRRPDGAPDYFVSVVEDIQTRKEAEAALRRQTAELSARNQELQRFDRAAVGRELEMIRLKRRVNVLACRLNEAPPYDLSWIDDPAAGTGEVAR